jgi:hypothetical protein
MATIQAAFNSVRQSNAVNKGDCGTAARAVFKHFRTQLGYNGQPQTNTLNATVQDLINQWNVPQQAIYLVCVNTSKSDFTVQEDSDATGDGWKWEHCFAVHQDGLQLMPYQAFVGCYKLGEWCSGVFPNQATAPKAKYSPRNGANVPNAEAARWAANVGRFATAGKDEAGRLAGIIFGGGSTSPKTLSLGVEHNGIKVRWVKRTAGAAQNNNNGQPGAQSCILI